MYRIKEVKGCEMPECDSPVKVLVLNASLKHAPETSNTEEVSEVILGEMRRHGAIVSEVVRLADLNINVGLGFKEGDDDEWPDVAEKMRNADIVLFATPVWWGGMSSLMQRVVERMDAFDEEALAGGRSAFLNKVGGIVITGSEDGAQSVMAKMMSTLSFMNFTLPPQACTYWVGEVGMDPKTDRARRLESLAVSHMAAAQARNAMYYARLLKTNPLSER